MASTPAVMVREALAVHPVLAAAGAAVAAMALSRRGGFLRWSIALAAIAAAWYAGGGSHLLDRASGAIDATRAGSILPLAALLLAVVLGLALSSGIAAWAGAFVGRRVIFGTGWASAGVVAATVSVALLSLL